MLVLKSSYDYKVSALNALQEEQHQTLDKLSQLEAENTRLKAENRELQETVNRGKKRCAKRGHAGCAEPDERDTRFGIVCV